MYKKGHKKSSNVVILDDIKMTLMKDIKVVNDVC